MNKLESIISRLSHNKIFHTFFSYFPRIFKVGLFGMAFIAIGLTIHSSGSQIAWDQIYIRWEFIFLAILMSWLGFIVAIIIWHMILARFNLKTHFVDDIRIYTYSVLAGTIPGSIWNVLGRSVLYQQIQVNPLIISTATIVDTLLVGLASVFVCSVMGWLYPQAILTQNSVTWIGIGVLTSIVLIPPVFNRLFNWVTHTFLNIESSVVHFRWLDLLTWIISDGLVIVLGGVVVYVVFNSAYLIPAENLPYILAAYAMSSSISTLLFWFPGTMFLRDGSMIIALLQVLPLEIAILLTVFLRLWTICFCVITAVVVWLVFDRHFPFSVNEVRWFISSNNWKSFILMIMNKK